MTWFWYQNNRIEILHKMALRKKIIWVLHFETCWSLTLSILPSYKFSSTRIILIKKRIQKASYAINPNLNWKHFFHKKCLALNFDQVIILNSTHSLIFFFFESGHSVLQIYRSTLRCFQINAYLYFVYSSNSLSNVFPQFRLNSLNKPNYRPERILNLPLQTRFFITYTHDIYYQEINLKKKSQTTLNTNSLFCFY